MKLSVREAFASYSYHKEYALEFTSDTFDGFPNDAVTDKVNAAVVISSESGVVTCDITVSAVFKTVCSRCLKEFSLPFETNSKKLVRRDQTEDFEDVIYADSSLAVDIVEEIRTLIYFEFPAKPLCSEDCKGLCPVCGCDLNTDCCSCDIRTVDPRLAVLKKLIDK